MTRDLRARLSALQDALGELLDAAGAPQRLRRVDDRPYRLSVATTAGELSAVRVPIAVPAALDTGLRLRVRAGDAERVAEIAAASFGAADAATFTFEPLPRELRAEAVELTFESTGPRGQRAPALRLTAAGRPALLFGHGTAGAVARSKRPPLLSRDNWIEAARLLRRDGPVALGKRIVRRLTRPPAAPPRPWRDRYPEWLARRADPGDIFITSWRVEAAAAGSPRFTVAVLPGRGDASESVASARAQLWEAAAVIDLSAAAEVRWPAADADYLVPLRAGDRLPPHALLRYAAAAAARPALITADEDRLGPGGARGDPFFKPSLTMSRLRCEDWVAGAAAFRVDAAYGGGALSSWEGSLWDAALRRAEAGPPARVQDVLYSRRGPREAAPEADARALLGEAAARAGWQGARVSPGRTGSTWRVAPAIAGRPLVSIVIPFRDQPGLLERAVASIEARSTWRRFELLLVDNGSRQRSTRSLLKKLSAAGARVLRQPGPFNFARINNAAVREARGELVLLLNNDVEVVSPGWLEALIEHAQRPEVGAVGARLLFPEGFMQHAGVILGMGGIAGHPGRLLRPETGGYHGSFDAVHDYSAVTAACLMMRRELFLEAGGLDQERLPVGFNDVDLCLRLRRRGLSIVYTPFAELLHHESVSRGPRVDDAEVRTMRERWGALLYDDPYYNANLSLERSDFEVRP